MENIYTQQGLTLKKAKPTVLIVGDDADHKAATTISFIQADKLELVLFFDCLGLLSCNSILPFAQQTASVCGNLCQPVCSRNYNSM